MNQKHWQGYIYKITYTPTGQVYIGQSVGDWNKPKRMEVHFKTKNKGQLIDRFINYKGKENFTTSVIDKIEMFSIKGDFKARLDNTEIFWIWYYDSFECGFNLSKGGGGTFGRKGELSGRYNKPAWNSGKSNIYDDEALKRMSVGHKGLTPWSKGLTKETDERLAKVASKMSDIKKGQVPWNKGLTKDIDERIVGWNKGLTKETDERLAKTSIKISESTKGRPAWNKGLTKETDERIKSRTAWNKGLTKETDERLAKIGEKVSKTNTGRVGNKGQVPWNKGLTKETDERVANGARNTSKSMKGKPSPLKGTKKNKPAWNSGLTKETDERVAKYGQKQSNTKRTKNR